MFIRKEPFVGGLMAGKQVFTDEHPVLVEADDVLARYGDVPVAYAVFRVKLNDDATEVADTEYVYTNNLYREWLGFGDIDLEGKSFLETVEDANTLWFPYCYRAVVLHEGSHDVVYSPEIDSWLSFNVEPSSMEGCCIFAFTKVDDEHQEHDAYCRYHRHHQARQEFFGVSFGASWFHGDPFGDFHLFEFFINFKVFVELSGSGYNISRNGDASQSITVGHVVMMETRLDVGNLTQRYPCSGVCTRY